MDMTIDIMAQHGYGRAALKKFGEVPENFRLFAAGWVPQPPDVRNVMRVKGAEFKRALSGPNKGRLSIMVPGTTRTVYVTTDAIRACTQGTEDGKHS